jgi:hypothetical protein
MNEDERISLIKHYHKRARIRMPNHLLHATIHTVVENQVAMGDETPVKDTLQRLMQEGLDRHDAIHAIGCMLAEHIHGMMNDPELNQKSYDPNEKYFQLIKELTAEKWKKIGQETGVGPR